MSGLLPKTLIVQEVSEKVLNFHLVFHSGYLPEDFPNEIQKFRPLLGHFLWCTCNFSSCLVDETPITRIDVPSNELISKHQKNVQKIEKT